MAGAEPVYDVVRGITTVAIFKIAWDQVKNLHETLFTSDCDHCRGTGKLTCPYCSGTKKLRKWPATIAAQELGLAEQNRDDYDDVAYDCHYCGSWTRYDLKPTLEEAELDPDAEEDAWKIMDNVKLARVGKHIKRGQRFEIDAGCIECPSCEGQGSFHRHTLNLKKLLNWEDPVFFTVGLRLGQRWLGKENRPETRRADHLEYPAPCPLPNPEHPYMRSEDEVMDEIDRALKQRKDLIEAGQVQRTGSQKRDPEKRIFNQLIYPYVDDEWATDSEDNEGNVDWKDRILEEYDPVADEE